MEALICAVGNEVLTGKTINTNAAYLASELEKLGINVRKVITVGDNRDDIKTVVKDFIASSSKLLITTGGLGPTHDDFTKEAICEALNLKLVYNPAAALDMYNYFGEVKTDCNVKQSYFPADSKIIPNHIGSADGVIITHEDKTIIMLVGPPYELQPMFEETVIPYLKTYGNEQLVQEFIVMGKSESALEELLKPFMQKYNNVEIAPYADNAKIRYRLTSQNKKAFTEALSAFRTLMAPYIISENNETIEEVVVKELIKKQLTVSFAESCTGGMLASMITSVPHASQVIKESLVVYSGEAKSKYLHVAKDIVEKKIVSEECALSMVKGLYELTKSDVCASITGYAGPDGEEVGRVCYAIKYGNKIKSFSQLFHGNREMIRIRAARTLLYQMHLLIN